MAESSEFDLQPTPESDPWVHLVHLGSGRVVARLLKTELAIALAPAPKLVLAR